MTSPAWTARHVDSRAMLMCLASDVRALLAVHRPDELNMCAGCRVHWGRMVPHPCSQAVWAGAVDERIPTPATLALLGLPARVRQCPDAI